MSATAGEDPKAISPDISNNKNKQTSNTKRAKKRKRYPTPEEQYSIERIDKYNKLHHACSKHLRREAKVVKSFECQKIVRAIKTARDNTTHGGDGDKTKNVQKAKKRLETLQQKLDRTKQMDLDVLVQVGLKRLGVLSLDPSVPVHKEEDNTTDYTKTAKPMQTEDPFYQTLLETMLRHKRLSTSLDQLNEKVTEYRQWINTNRDDITAKKKKKKKQKGKSESNDTMIVAGGYNSRRRGLDLGGHEGASGLFIGSLSGVAVDDDGYNNDNGEQYVDGYEEGDNGNYGYQEEKKKNRPGQRARRAKAMAIEARNAGKIWDSSINWREKKTGDADENKHYRGQKESNDGKIGDKNDKNKSSGKKGGRRNDDNNTDTKPKAKEAQQIASLGKTWKEEGNAHPSWVAKAAAQKSQGIAKFEGKKITF